MTISKYTTCETKYYGKVNPEFMNCRAAGCLERRIL